jgi:hypothetical protein
LVDVGGNVEVVINGTVAKLELKDSAINIVRNRKQRGRFHGETLHDRTPTLNNCGFRLRFRSPKAAAISFQRAIVEVSPTAGAIASITR